MANGPPPGMPHAPGTHELGMALTAAGPHAPHLPPPGMALQPPPQPYMQPPPQPHMQQQQRGLAGAPAPGADEDEDDERDDLSILLTLLRTKSNK